jgi:hypothetical protein
MAQGKTKFKFLKLLLLSAIAGFGAGRALAIDADLGRFITAKQQQIREMSTSISNKVPGTVWSFFNAVRVDDWETASNLADRLNAASHRYTQTRTDNSLTPALETKLWAPISESWGAYGQFHTWNSRWLHRFGSEIIQSIPRGSIYFGGTDPGRFVISALVESQVEGQPFFILTQNQLADSTYDEYLRGMYDKKIWIPTNDSLTTAFQDYLTNARVRLEHDRKFPNEPRQIKPGETVEITPDGRVQVSGQIAVMEINGLIVKKIFEQNADREFFIEESFPLEWMYPYLTPHGLIFHLNHQRLDGIPEQELAADHDYWKKLTDEALGGWLNEQTSVKQVCDLTDKYGMGRHLEDFKGDKDFAKNEDARKTFSKLRSSIAGLYKWRAEHARDAEERKRMYEAADFAYRQAYALCPISPEASYNYISLLANHNRYDDAILIAKTSLHLDPDNRQLQDLLSKLMQYR